MAYTCWILSEEDRDRLLEIIPPNYPDVIAHHITDQFGVPADTIPPSQIVAKFLSVVDDGNGVQAIVVSVNGEVKRSDGNIFHITWSIDRSLGRKPVHSNDVINKGNFPHVILDNITVLMDGATLR